MDPDLRTIHPYIFTATTGTGGVACKLTAGLANPTLRVWGAFIAAADGNTAIVKHGTSAAQPFTLPKEEAGGFSLEPTIGARYDLGEVYLAPTVAAQTVYVYCWIS
jgi:hypothetical protein